MKKTKHQARKSFKNWGGVSPQLAPETSADHRKATTNREPQAHAQMASRQIQFGPATIMSARMHRAQRTTKFAPGGSRFSFVGDVSNGFRFPDRKFDEMGRRVD